MGKEQGRKGSKANHNKHLSSRISYLHRAATYLTTVSHNAQDPKSSLPAASDTTFQDITALVTELRTRPTQTLPTTNPSPPPATYKQASRTACSRTCARCL